MTLIHGATRLAVVAACATAFGCGTAPHPSAPSTLPTNPTPPNLAGDYEITFVAENCDARPPQPEPPSEFRSRTYASRLEQDGVSIRVVMTGVPRIFDLEHPALWGQIQPDGTVKLTNYLGNDQWDAIFDQVSPTNQLAIFVSEMRVRASPQGLAGTFIGSFLIYDASVSGSSQISSGCSSSSHSVAFAR